MKANSYHLLTSRRFLPLLIAQFLGAFHDNLFKSALVVLLLYNPAFRADLAPQILTTLAAGVFILPFLLFSPLAGQLADRYSRGRVIQGVKAAEIGIALIGAAALLNESVELCFATLFCLGTHSAIFGPSRYAILPDTLTDEELVGGNALLNMVIFLAILGGTIIGTILVTLQDGILWTASLLLGCAAIGYLASRFIPHLPSQSPGMPFRFNLPAQIYGTIRKIGFQGRDIIFAVGGIGWFYFLGAMFMAQFANYTYETLQASENVLTFFLAIFSIGVAVGSLLSDRILRGQVKASLAPAALLGITLFSLDFYFANINLASHPDGHVVRLEDFFDSLPYMRITFDLFMIALCGGLFEVPLNAVIQHRTPDASRASVLAGSALINACFVILSSLLSVAILGNGWSVMDLFLAFACANAVITGIAFMVVFKNRTLA